MRTALLALLCMASCPVLHANQFKPTPRQTYEIFNQLFLAELAVDPKKNPDYLKVKDLKEDLEIEMGVRIRVGEKETKLLREPLPEDLRKLKGFLRDRRDAYKQAVAKYDAHHDQAARHYDKAISLAVKYYYLEPPEVSGTVRNGHSGVRGNRLDWRPKFVAKPPEHLKGRDIDGMTSADRNSIEIYPGALLYPGLLAATLRHEQVHYRMFLKSPKEGPLLSNEFAEEAWIVRHIMQEQADYDLFPKDFLDNIVAWAVNQEESMIWWRKLLDGNDPSANPEVFAAITISEERKKEISDSIQLDLAAFMNYDTTVANAASMEDLPIEWIKSKGQSDFVQKLTNAQFFDLLKGWKKSREAAQNKTKDLRKMAVAGFEWEAQRCGFAYTMEGGRAVGFHRDWPGGGRSIFRFNRGMDMDSIKASMLLAKACIETKWRPENYGAPCNDALDIVNNRWGDPVFRQKVDLWGDKDEVDCVSHARDNLRLPADHDGLKGIVLEAWAEYRRRQSSGAGGSPGRTSPPASHDGGESGHGIPGIDFSKAEEALERARGASPR